MLIRIRIFRIQGFSGVDVWVEGSHLHRITEIFIEISSNLAYHRTYEKHRGYAKSTHHSLFPSPFAREHKRRFLGRLL